MKATIKCSGFFLLFLMVPSFSFSQSSIDINVKGEGYFTIAPRNKPEKKTDGCPYYNSVWSECQVNFGDAKIARTDSFKYDIFEGKLIFLSKGIEYYVPDNDKIISFSAGNIKFINFESEGVGGKCFFEVLNESPSLKLLKKHRCKIVEGKPGDGIDPGRNDRYVLFSEYYTSLNNLPAKKLKLTRDNVLALMADHKAEVQTYIKENRLKVKMEDDLIKLFKYYSTF